LKEKISRPGKSYTEPLSEIPDLVGVRLILYYQDEIATVGSLIEEQFDIIEKESSHQPDGYSPDQFGYISMHYVVLLNKKRADLPEWKAFKGIKVEIQVRTLLQHSWAGISHALQYKQEGDVPIMLRRKLFRLAGLFELADEEFVGIRNERDSIVEESIKSVHSDQKEIRVDAPVIREFLKTSPTIESMQSELESIGYKFVEDDEHDFVGLIVNDCNSLDIQTLENIEELLNRDYTPYFKSIFLKQWTVSRDFVLYVLLIATHPEAYSIESITNKGWSEDIARRILDKPIKAPITA